MMLKNSAILAFLLKYKKEPLGIRRARVFVKPNLKHSTICSNEECTPCSVTFFFPLNHLSLQHQLTASL